MTQLFLSLGLGTQGSSLGLLGGYGPKGNAGLGQGGIGLSVNAATGNGVLKQSDGFLADFGVGLDLFQTYNTQNGAWQFNTDTRIVCEGPINTEGSVVTRTDEDGHQSRFVYDAASKAYWPDDGSTARLLCDGTDWQYREGGAAGTCHYNLDGQLTRMSDRDGHALQFHYENGRLTRIQDTTGQQSVTWSFEQGLLREVTAQSEGLPVHRLRYDYDAQHRLNRVGRDLGDGQTYWIAYDYAGDSNRINGIRQSDGTCIHLDYDTDGRIQRLVDGEGRITLYDYQAGKTRVTNGLGESFTYYYDEKARLTGIDGPEQRRIRYHYDGTHLDAITDGTEHWAFQYNAAGDCVRVESPTGEVTQRTYDAEHHLLSETRYSAQEGPHQTARFVYDEAGHLRFEITTDGVVTEHRYDAHGNRISRRCYLLARFQDTASNLNALTQWSALQNQQAIHLVDYRYDVRGCLSEEIHFTAVDGNGFGISTPDAIRTLSRYDAAGRLVEQSSVTATGGLSTTHYVYDNLGRLIQTIDNQHHTQRFEYDDVHQRMLKTDANGLQTLSIYDKSGLLLSTHRLDSTHDLGTITYQYDAAGRLLSETDVTGQTRYQLYDSLGRLQASISTSGQVTEYTYDDDGHCIQTHQYQQTVHINSLQAPTFLTIKPASHAEDRIRQFVYNAHHQLAFQVDAAGGVTAYQYDAQGRITKKTAHANRFQMDVAPVASIDDRTWVYYYDTAGRLQADVDGEGAATAYRYDAEGHLIETVRYQNLVSGTYTGDWTVDAPVSQRDIHTYSLYNAAGLKVADIDAERYLTEYTYDARGLLSETIAYDTQLPASFETHSLDAIRPNAHTNDHHTTYRYNDLSQCIEERTHSGLVTTYAYDAAGHVTRKTRMDAQTHAARSQCFRYDAMGRMTQSLDALGAALLTEGGDVEAIWQQHSVRYQYDLAGHLVSQTNALHETRHFVYNDAGRLTYQVDATGAITETRYNAFEQVDTTIRYAATYPAAANRTWATLQSFTATHANPQDDITTQYTYNTVGLLLSQRTGNGRTQTMTYNAFGECSSLTQNTRTDYQYDRRGLLRHRTEEALGVNKTFEMAYDAFGRMSESVDARHGLSVYQYNQRGEQTRMEDAGHAITTATYDAFGRMRSSQSKTDASYIYDDQTHTLRLTRTGDDAIITTQFNAFGDKLSITDGYQQTTTYQYDARGLLVHVEAPEHSAMDYTYDADGRLTFQSDAEGRVRRFTYDAENRVLTQTIDPEGLNLTTTYTYDAFGRQLQVVLAERCTQFRYDTEGRLIETRSDPAGLNLTTTYGYDESGHLVRETRSNSLGADWVTAYTRDAWGRCLSRTIDPDGLNLTTAYAYDAQDNLIRQTDPNQHTTHFVYDANHRVRYRIDARGVVTEHRYDLKGNEQQTTTYANRVQETAYDEATLATLIEPDRQADHHQFFAFDAQSRLVQSYDGLGYATVYRYDSHDNCIEKKQYDTPCSLDALMNGHTPVPENPGASRTTRFVYDGLNHERYRIDSEGFVTAFRYDAAGLMTERTRMKNRVNVALADMEAQLKPDALQDETTHYAYDPAGRLTMEVSAAGVATAYTWNAAGQSTERHQYAMRLTPEALSDTQWASRIQASAEDRITRTEYDAAGRERRRISPLGHIIEREYDAAGNVVAEINAARRTQFDYDAAGRLTEQTDAAHRTTRYTYDANNNVESKIDAKHARWTYHYNACNQLIETHAPITSFTTYVNGVWREETRSVITANEYDAFGNTCTVIRDVGGLHQTVHFTHDANNRLLQTRYPNVAVNQASLTASMERQERIQTLTETYVYNAFGDVIEHRDRAGTARFFCYDAIGQRTHATDGEGAVTRYAYDAFGNVCSKTRYATRINGMPLDTPIINQQDRHEMYVYDKDHHLIEQHQDETLTYNPRTGAYTALPPITQRAYSVFGELLMQSVRLSETDWATTAYRYNADGLMVAQRDAEQYLTTYHYNEDGQLTDEMQYATRTNQWTTPARASNDRHIGFTYDAVGQQLTRTLYGVCVSRLTGPGAQHETTPRDLVSHYAYDALGHLVSTTDAEGFTAYSYYNDIGQVVAKLDAATPAGRPAVTYRYDALGQLVDTHAWANGAQAADETAYTLNGASASDVIRRNIYDAEGRVTETIDGNGAHTYYSYDARGNLARCWQVLHQADQSAQWVDKRYTYDREQHLTQTALLHATGVMMTDDAAYNAFGELEKKGVNGAFSIHMDYDRLGRVWRSNAQGTYQLYGYDLDGHVTQVVTSSNSVAGLDLSLVQYDDMPQLDVRLLHRQDNIYDALGQLTAQTQDGARGDAHDLTPRTTQTQTLDRWGNRLEHTNALGFTTHYTYNALNALIQQALPVVNVVDEHGVTRALAPVITYAVDGLGRTIAITDANGHATAYRFDANGHVTEDIDARGFHRNTTYNLLGQRAQQTNERGFITAYTYDHENRLLSVSTSLTTQHNAYDEAGQLIRQIDAAGNTQTFAFDTRGLQVQRTSGFSNMHYEYDAAGHKTTEMDASGRRNTWAYDGQGRVTEHTDLGGHRTNYAYNINGLLVDEIGSTGKHQTRTYFSDGQLQTYTDLARQETVAFTYDANGQVATQSSERALVWAKTTDHYEYDAQGRLSRVHRDNAPSDLPVQSLAFSIAYEYDAVGNIRDAETSAHYENYNPITRREYFCYDENNRVIINKGTLVNGVIDITPSQGTFVAYDATGNLYETYVYEGVTKQHYQYDYNAENQVTRIRRNGLDLQRMRFVSGLLVEKMEHNGYGNLTRQHRMAYTYGVLTWQDSFNENGAHVGSKGYRYDNMGNLTQLVVQECAIGIGLWYKEIHDYDYVFWDSYLQSSDRMTYKMERFATTTALSTRRYDLNGLLENVTDTPYQTNTTDYYASSLDGVVARKDRTGQTGYLSANGKTLGDLRIDQTTKKQTLTTYVESASKASIAPPEDQPGFYTANTGDTLEQIALQVYGDRSLWYLIAEANGITERSSIAGEKGGQLHVGMRLKIPSTARAQHHTNDTHTVMTSTDWTGNTSPTAGPLVSLQPHTAPPSNQHGNRLWRTLASIAGVVIAAAAMIMSAGVLAVITTAGASFAGLGFSGLASLGISALGGTGVGLLQGIGIGLVSGVTSNIAGQVAAVAFHQQNGIDFKSALMTGLATAAAAGIGHLINTTQAYQPFRKALDAASPKAFNLLAATEMMERDAASQALNIAIGHYQAFNWKELGASAATAGIMGGAAVQNASQYVNDKLHSAGAFVTSEAQALVEGAATGHFDALQILQDNLGNAVAASVLQPTPESTSITFASDEVEPGGYCPIPTPEPEETASAIPEGTWERFHREQSLRNRLDAIAAKAKLDAYAAAGSGLADVGASSLGVIGDAAYGEASSLPLAQGALKERGGINVASSIMPLPIIDEHTAHLIRNESVKPTDVHANFQSEKNKFQLATVLMSEVSVGNYAEQVAVGNTVLNRMQRNKTTNVADVWNAYGRNQSPSQEMLDLSAKLLAGKISDNTGGATHYYSPRSMPQEGDPINGSDVRGGLEQVIGLTAKNYRPSFTTTFKYVNVPDVREEYFKFYFAPGTGKVR